MGTIYSTNKYFTPYKLYYSIPYMKIYLKFDFIYKVFTTKHQQTRQEFYELKQNIAPCVHIYVSIHVHKKK